MYEYALISDVDIVTGLDSEEWLREHLEKDFTAKEYKKYFGNGRAMIVKIVWVDDRSGGE